MDKRIDIDYRIKSFSEILSYIQTCLDRKQRVIAQQPYIVYSRYFKSKDQVHELPDRIEWERFKNHRMANCKQARKNAFGGLLIPLGVLIFHNFETELYRTVGFWTVYFGCMYFIFAVLLYLKNQNEIPLDQWQGIQNKYTEKSWQYSVFIPILSSIVILVLMFLLFKILDWGMYTFL